MPTEHTLLLALFGLLALTVGLLALLIYLVLSDRHRRGAEDDDLCDALLEGVAGAKREIEGTVAKTDARLSAGLSSLITYSTTEQKRSSESVERFAASARGDLARMNETLAKEFLSLQSMVDERFAKVLQTNAGAQEALDLIAKTFLNPGDIVLAEGPTYLGALQAFSAYEPDIRCIPFDDEGMRVDLLEEELARIGKGNPRLKFLYTIPNFQNPGGVTMVPARRKRLLELSEEYGFMVVEDDPYGRLRYGGGRRAAAQGALGRRRVPGHRVEGVRARPAHRWIVAPKSVLAKINLVKQGTDLCGSAFNQVVVEHYFTDTPWQKTLQKFVKTYRTRRDAMLAALDEHFPAEATWTRPEGGVFSCG